MKRLKSVISLFLVLALSLSLSANAAVQPQSPATQTVTRLYEVETLRETNSETYLLSDGSYECVVYAEDKYYYDDSQSLKRIDNSIAKISTSAYTTRGQYKNAANAFDVYFSDSGTPEVNIVYNGTAISFTPVSTASRRNLQANTDRCVMAVGKIENCTTLNELTTTGDNTVIYNDAFNDTDLVYVLENSALKEYIILNSPNASNAFSFMFTLENVTLQTTGNSAYFTAADGSTVFALDTLFAVDANGAVTENLSYSFAPVANTNKVLISVTLDDAYLSSSDRAFPVIIDPSIMISSSETADACVCSNTPDTNYQMATQLRTGYEPDYGIRRSYIKFDIPDTIPLFSVTNASLEIEKLSGVNPTIRAYRCTSAWSSATLTWRHKPDYAATDFSPLSTIYSTGSTWYKMDVTTIVQSWVNAIYTNYGFLLKDNTEDNASHWTTLYSSDAASPHKPELHITYEIERIRLYGISNSGHDHLSGLQYVSNLLDSYGYTNNTIQSGSFEPSIFKEQLKTSRIVTTRSHGVVIIDSNNNVLATGLLLNDNTGAGQHLILNENTPPVCAAYTYITNNDSFNHLDLALFIGCETALNGTNQSNFTAKVATHGAKAAVGFEDTIYCESANDWTEMFYEHFLNGGTVVSSTDYACVRVASSTGLRSAVIYGDESLTIS